MSVAEATTRLESKSEASITGRRGCTGSSASVEVECGDAGYAPGRFARTSFYCHSTQDPKLRGILASVMLKPAGQIDQPNQHKYTSQTYTLPHLITVTMPGLISTFRIASSSSSAARTILAVSRRYFASEAKYNPSTVERASDEVDICIVGGGPAGLSAAIRLKQLEAERGGEVRVVVLEKGAEVGE